MSKRRIPIEIVDERDGTVCPMTLIDYGIGHEIYLDENDDYHSINDRPSIIATEHREWHYHGILHREVGPAKITGGGWKQLPLDQWYIKGEQVNPKEYSLKLYLSWLKREKERGEMKKLYNKNCEGTF